MTNPLLTDILNDSMKKLEGTKGNLYSFDKEQSPEMDLVESVQSIIYVLQEMLKENND